MHDHARQRRLGALLTVVATLLAGIGVHAAASQPEGYAQIAEHRAESRARDDQDADRGKDRDGAQDKEKDKKKDKDEDDGGEPPTPDVVRAVDGSDADWLGEPTWVPGTAGYDHGVWSFTDYPYDDKGTGSFAYPAEGDHGANSADPVVLQIALGDDAVHYLVRLNTLIRSDSTVVALAVDTDNDSQTGGGPWPYEAKLSTPGWDHIVTMWGTGATVTTASGERVDVPVAVNTHDNLIEVAVPFSVADPEGATWRYHGGAGLWAAAEQRWTEVSAERATPLTTGPVGKSSPEQPNVFNLLFRNRTWDGGTAATDENASGDFQSDRQAEALSSGDVTAFFRDVDFSILEVGATVVPAAPTDDQNFTRVYASAAHPNARPEGVSSEGARGFLYNGRYQPYILFVPATYWQDLPEPAPMIPQLHGWTGNHRSFNPSDNEFWNDVVRANRALVPKPLGRGGEIWYEHLGELDVLEVMADVAQHYAVDTDRIYLAGTSMGGLGTIKIAESHPDLFAGIFPSVPPMSDRAQGYVVPQNNDWDLTELAGSLRNVPVRNHFGTVDALVPANYDSERFCDALEELTYDHDCWRNLTGGHSNYDAARAAQIAQLLDEHRLVRDPARVTYRSHPIFRRQATEQGIDHLLRYDRAYWADNIRWTAPPQDGGCQLAECRQTPGYPRYPTDPSMPRQLTQGSGVSEIDVRTWGTGEGDPVAEPIADDPSPTLVRRGLVLRPGPAVPPRNAFELSATRVEALDLDLGRMSLTLTTPLTGTLTGAGTVELGLVGPGTGCAATVDGARVPITRDGDRLVLHVRLTDTPQQLQITCSS